jgi:hypothetical protein
MIIIVMILPSHQLLLVHPYPDVVLKAESLLTAY